MQILRFKPRLNFCFPIILNEFNYLTFKALWKSTYFRPRQGAVTCKSRIVHLKWLKITFAMRKCIGFDFNRFLHATGLDIWNRAKDVVPLHYQKLRARADVERRADDCSGSKFFTFHSSLFTLICGRRPPDVAGRKRNLIPCKTQQDYERILS